MRLSTIIASILMAACLIGLASDVVLFRVNIDAWSYATNGSTVTITISATTTTTIPGAGGLDSYVVAALHCDGASESTDFPAAYGTNLFYAQGGAMVTNASKFGTGALYCDGDGDYLSRPDTAGMEIGTNDFTVDFWVWLADSGSSDLFGKPAASTIAPIRIARESDSTIQFLGSTSGADWQWYIASPEAMQISNWVHVAAVRSGELVILFTNGIASVSNSSAGNTGALYAVTDDWHIGRLTAAYPAYDFAGRIDEFRLSVGIARWTGDFVTNYSAYSE